MLKLRASETSLRCRLWSGGSPQMRPASAASLTRGDHAPKPPAGWSPVGDSDAAHLPLSGAPTHMGDEMCMEQQGAATIRPEANETSAGRLMRLISAACPSISVVPSCCDMANHHVETQ